MPNLSARQRLVLDIVAAGVGERAGVPPGRQVEGVDLAVVVGEVADEQIAAELAETEGGQRDAPRRGEFAADDQLAEEVAGRVEDRHGPLAFGGPRLVGPSGGRVGHEISVPAPGTLMLWTLNGTRPKPAGSSGSENVPNPPLPRVTGAHEPL